MAPALEPVLEPAPNVRDAAAWQTAVSAVASATSTGTQAAATADDSGAIV